MAIVNPIVVKSVVSNGEGFKRVYICPEDKTDSPITLNFKQNAETDGTFVKIDVAVSKKVDPIELTEDDFVFYGLEIRGSFTFPEISKIVLGGGDNLYIRVREGVSVNVRITGLESINQYVIKAGTLGSLIAPSTDSKYEIFRLDETLSSYMTGTLAIINTTTQTIEVQGYITSNTIEPEEVDHIITVKINPGNASYVEGILLAPEERIYIQTDTPNVPFHLNGMVITSVLK